MVHSRGVHDSKVAHLRAAGKQRETAGFSVPIPFTAAPNSLKPPYLWKVPSPPDGVTGGQLSLDL